MRNRLALSAAAAILAAPLTAHAACAPDNGSLTLPEGMCASIFADVGGPTRHIVIDRDGTLYADMWGSPRRRVAGEPGQMIVALKDTDSDGKADKTARMGLAGDQTGGTGIAIREGYLYAEAGSKIVRFKLGAPNAQPETIVDGLPMTGDHTMHSIALGPDGALYVNSGSPSNACQERNRAPHSPGKDPCEELATRAGIWKFDANKTGQTLDAAHRYATGLRNTVALTSGPNGTLYALPHGRDQLHENWLEHFDVRQGAELPSEMLVRVTQGANFGWPYCYYDQEQSKYILAPEYGGDGKRTDRCTSVPAPIAAYPGHWAPNALLVYTGNALPARYSGGLFIAFHGSWNRDKQQGYVVVFQPLDASGNPNGKHEVFADGFAGPNKTPGGAAHRPTGLAQGPDGALYVSDDTKGRIWRIVSR